MRKITVFDTTLRDGEQSAGVNLNLQEKLEIARQLERLGVDIIEAGFPAASPGDLASTKEIAQTIKGASVTGLARASKKDIDAAWEALKVAAEPRLHVFLATSPIHRQHKLKMSKDEVVAKAVETVRYAKTFFPQVQFSAEDAGRTELEFLREVITAVIDAGATVVNIPDTVGYLMPEEYGAIFKYLKDEVPNIDKALLSAHCHDDLGFAVANSLAAIQNGATQVEGTINGIGERAGNAALEEILVNLNIRQDFYQAEARAKLDQLSRTSRLVASLTGMQVPPNKAVVGANAFAHESGIHQDGVLKERTTYEIISPQLVGLDSNQLVLGKHSGRHALKERMEFLGYSLSEEQLQDLFIKFKELADKKKELHDDDLVALVHDSTLTEDGDVFKLDYLHVSYMNSIATATIRLETPSGLQTEEAAIGSGSVEAIYNTIEKMVQMRIHLLDYKIRSLSKGRDALAEVYVKVSYEGFVGTGRGIDHDVLGASSKAFIDSINRLRKMKKPKHFIEDQEEYSTHCVQDSFN
ncbi:2-isopropylmalate synthase [Bacillus horti]|uniref:2-isopropylmalate synthase n=1 Tax=Caldalkalibacillus horti TaxID=77523 RepID=A0ABT9W1Y0_9BACI|nr:2-isopropylmalate synthase [Bacillus horti]MDQ0167249.1 2-isopropylmalate synthase [Bacillus horti]